MRADRLVSLVLLLRQRGRLSADVLARELEVSTRTVLRDIEALSAAGVPVYAEQGRHGGYSLLPGFRTELTGLNHDEALALIISGLPRGENVFGLSSNLDSGLRKLIDALPESHRSSLTDVTQRILVEPELDLLARRRSAEDVPHIAVMSDIRAAVFRGRRLRLEYQSAGESPRWRTVDPIGLVTARGRSYLLALADGEERTYRLSRVASAEVLDEPALRPEPVDLEDEWRRRSERFRRSRGGLTAIVRTVEQRAESLFDTAVDFDARAGSDGEIECTVTFQDLEHAEWALWQFSEDTTVLAPDSLRRRLRDRAAGVAARYSDCPSTP